MFGNGTLIDSIKCGDFCSVCWSNAYGAGTKKSKFDKTLVKKRYIYVKSPVQKRSICVKTPVKKRSKRTFFPVKKRSKYGFRSRRPECGGSVKRVTQENG